MVKGETAKSYREKSENELLADLKKLRDEVQKIRFTKGTGTAVNKVNSVKGLRKQIARVLTIIREKRKDFAVGNLLTRTVSEREGDKVKAVETKIKNLKMKHIPLDLRPKRTRAMRRRLTKFEANLLTLKQWKRKLNFPKRTFAVPVKA